MRNTHRFPTKRIAVTVPPGDWFHGIPRAMFDIYRGALAELSFEIFDVPVDAFLVPNAARIAGLLADLRTFQPELAFGLPKGSYALLCRLPAGRDGWRPNLFTEVLDIPTVCLWDHAPLDLADQLLTPPVDPAQSAGGALETLRRTLTHPRLIHWSPDTGQTQIMQELGFLLPKHVIHESLPSLPGFARQGIRPLLDNGRGPSVGFVGHLYQERPAHPHRALETFAGEAIQAWLPDSSRPLWYVLADRIAALDPTVQQQLALHRDQTYFWHFAHHTIIHEAQTALRLSVLGSAGVPVTCYGNLKMDVPGVPRNLTPVPGSIPFGPELADALVRNTITIDVFNPGSIHGHSHKPLMAFAAGGFMLVNRRRDFIQSFGEAGEAVSYDQDLGAKIDRFLTNPKYLLETQQAIREIIFARFQLKDVLTRVLDAAVLCAEGVSVRATASGPVDPPEQVIVVKNLLRNKLLKKIRSRPEWTGASVEYRDRTALIVAPQQWGYAAEIRIPAAAKKMREPHLCLHLIVEAGMIGIAASLDHSDALIGEQMVGPSAAPIRITVELPHKGVSSVILRNTADTPSRVRVLEASLCDRVIRPA